MPNRSIRRFTSLPAIMLPMPPWSTRPSYDRPAGDAAPTGRVAPVGRRRPSIAGDDQGVDLLWLAMR
jgi:hypothetical protein